MARRFPGQPEGVDPFGIYESLASHIGAGFSRIYRRRMSQLLIEDADLRWLVPPRRPRYHVVLTDDGLGIYEVDIGGTLTERDWDAIFYVIGVCSFHHVPVTNIPRCPSAPYNWYGDGPAFR